MASNALEELIKYKFNDEMAPSWLKNMNSVLSEFL